MTMILVSQCIFFFNNYTKIVLSITNLAFKALHDANPSTLVFRDRHKSCLVDTEEVCILLNIKYYYIL